MADNSDLAREGVASAERAFRRHLHWAFRDQPIDDYGIDAHIEPKRNGVPGGRLIAAQIKSGSSYFRIEVPGGWHYPSSSMRHLRYWLNFVLPVIIILYDPSTGICYWQHVASEHITYTDSGWRLWVPSGQTLSADAAAPLLKIAGGAAGASEDLLASHIAVLPPVTAAELAKADKADPDGALRLAQMLAHDRAEPELIIRSLLAAQPSWWAAGKGRFDMILAAYAAEHGHLALSAKALARAVAAHEDPSHELYANAAYFAALVGERGQSDIIRLYQEEGGRSPLLRAIALAGGAPARLPPRMPAGNEGDSAIDRIVREGARRMLAAALQAEVDAYIDRSPATGTGRTQPSEGESRHPKRP